MINLNIIPLWVKAVALAVALGAAGTAGWHVRDYDYQKHLKADARAALAAQQAARKVEAKHEEIGQQIGQETEAALVRERVITRTLIKEVPVYVTQESDDRCVVPLGAVRLLDAAATGNPPVPATPGEPHDAPSGLELSAVTASVVDNYGYTREIEAQLTGLQAWVRDIEKAWPK